MKEKDVTYSKSILGSVTEEVDKQRMLGTFHDDKSRV